MWTIDQDAVDAVSDIRSLSSFVVEKDFRVVEVLSTVLQAKIPEGVRLAFAGGTCLARAHKIVERMSEDVDMKVVVDGASTMSKSALRSLLSETKHAITDAIKAAGFIMPEEPKARNGNQHQLRDLGTATRRL